MRLKEYEIEAIKDTTQRVFGPKATVHLFGSRTDDHKKGGDIDLFIQCHRQIARAELYDLKIKFLVSLKKAIGDQRIDVLIEGGHTRNMFQQLKTESIQL